MTVDPRASVFRGPAWPLALAILALIACGDDGGDEGGPDAAVDAVDAAPGADGSTSRATGFVANPAGYIHLVEGFAGEFQDPIRPGAALRDRPDLPRASLLASEGPCEIWTHPTRPPECDPPCQDGACVADGECEPFPVPVSAGEIAMSGTLEPLSFVPGEFGYGAVPELPKGDLFADGAVVSASAEGADAPGFELEAVGVVPLEADLDLEFDVTLVIEDGVDEVIRWVPTGEPPDGWESGSRTTVRGGVPASSGSVQIALQVGWHGAPYEALLVCEADDADGELVIPGSLIARFPARENPTGEAHSHWIARFTRDVVESAAGPIELVLASRILILQIDHR